MHQTFFAFSLNDHDPRCRERNQILLPSYGIGDAMVRWQLPPPLVSRLALVRHSSYVEHHSGSGVKTSLVRGEPLTLCVTI